jgi:hypothetical protein
MIRNGGGVATVLVGEDVRRVSVLQDVHRT